MSILSQFFEGRHKSQAKQADQNEEMVSIFSSTFPAPQPRPSNEIDQVVKKKGKKQQVESSEQVQVQHKKSLSKKKAKLAKKQQKQQSIEKDMKSEKKKKKEKPYQVAAKVEQEKPEEPQNLDSTVFVGNVPLSSTHKSLKKYFQKYGKVLKVWFRSIPVQQSKIPKKGLHILKKYQQGADSMNAYVKFQNQSEAEAACDANGNEYQGKNIKVTLCNQFELDYETTIFIGNLPRNIKDQQLWEAFRSVGTVKSVRVIRNKQTLEGIGIGYVRFGTKQEMRKAISEMNGKKIGDRQMRIKKAVPKQRLQKKVRKIKQNKQKKFKKSVTIQKIGKGIPDRGEKNRVGSLRNQGMKNSNYSKKKPINKDFANKKRFQREQPKKPFLKPRNEDKKQDMPSNSVIRSKFGFAGKKIMLQ